jgi:hypothetical protein
MFLAPWSIGGWWRGKAGEGAVSNPEASNERQPTADRDACKVRLWQRDAPNRRVAPPAIHVTAL